MQKLIKHGSNMQSEMNKKFVIDNAQEKLKSYFEESNKLLTVSRGPTNDYFLVSVYIIIKGELIELSKLIADSINAESTTMNRPIESVLRIGRPQAIKILREGITDPESWVVQKISHELYGDFTRFDHRSI